MNGSVQGLRDILFKDWLEEVPLNKLEIMLLEKYLENPQEHSDEIANTLIKARERLRADDNGRRGVKCLERVIPLFEKHDFWST